MPNPNRNIPDISLDLTRVGPPSGGSSGFVSPLTTKGDIYVRSTVDVRLPVGTDGFILTADSTQTTGLKWSAGSSAVHDLLSATHTDTLTASVVRGDLIAGNATPKWSRLAVGTVGKFLRTDGTDPSWQFISASDIVTGFTAGSVIFAGVTGALTEDNVNFFWDDTNNRLGLGTSAPGNALSITGVRAINTLVQWNPQSTGTSTSQLTGFNLAPSFNPGGASLSTIIGETTIPNIVGTAFTISNYYAHSVRLDSTAGFSGIITNAINLQINNASFAGGTITTLQGVVVNDLTVGTNNRGYVGAVTIGSNKWNLYMSGTAQNYLNGWVGIGLSVPTSQLQLSETITTAAGTTYQLQTLQTFNPAGADAATHRNWVRLQTANANAQTFTSLQTLFVETVHQGTAALSQAISVAGLVQNTNTGTVSTAFALYGRIDSNNAGGTVSTGYGCFIEAFTRTGTITNSFGIYVNDTIALNVLRGGLLIGSTTNNARLYVVQPVATSGTPNPAFRVDGGAHTTLANAEVIDVNFNLARTVQFTGNVSLVTQRAAYFQAPTYSSDTATKHIQTGATVTISGAPIAGTNLLIDTAYALWVQSGTTRLAGDLSVVGTATFETNVFVIGQFEIDGTFIIDTTISTITLAGAAWKTLTTNGSGVMTFLAHQADGRVYSSKGATTAPAYRTLNSTPNQVTVTINATDFTFSTPQDIHVLATPQFSRLGLGAPASAIAGIPVWIERSGTMSSFYNDTSQAADNRLWYQAISSGTFIFGVENDAFSVIENYLKITRSGATVSGVRIPPSKVFVGSDTAPSGHFQVNGLSQFNRTSNGDDTIKAGYSVVVSTDYTILSGATITIEADGILAIIN